MTVEVYQAGKKMAEGSTIQVAKDGVLASLTRVSKIHFEVDFNPEKHVLLSELAGSTFETYGQFFKRKSITSAA